MGAGCKEQIFTKVFAIAWMGKQTKKLTLSDNEKRSSQVQKEVESSEVVVLLADSSESSEETAAPHTNKQNRETDKIPSPPKSDVLPRRKSKELPCAMSAVTVTRAPREKPCVMIKRPSKRNIRPIIVQEPTQEQEQASTKPPTQSGSAVQLRERLSEPRAACTAYRQKSKSIDNVPPETMEILRSESLRSFVCADPHGFMNLVETENRLACLRVSGSQEEETIAVSGLTEEEIATINALLAIQKGETIETPKTPRTIFKQTYTIINSVKPRTVNQNTNETSKLSFQVFEELIATERMYRDRLVVIIEHFLEPVRRRKLLNSFEIVSLFSNIEKVLSQTQSLLDDFEVAQNISEDPNIIPLFPQWVGEIFARHASQIQSIYGTYCTNQPTIESTLRQLQKKEKFSKFLKHIYRKTACQRQDLNSLLISPLQRLCKYPLLLREMIKYTPTSSPQHSILVDGYNELLSCVDNVNQKVKIVENLTKCTEITMNISNITKYRNLIIDSSSEFIMSEHMIVNENIRNIYLFNHMILVCKQTPENLKMQKSKPNQIEYFILHVLPLNLVSVDDILHSETNFVLKCKENEFLIKCKDIEQKKKWFERTNYYRDRTNGIPILSSRKSRMITLGKAQPKPEKGNRRKSIFGSSAKSLKNDIGKLQKDLKQEQIRRKVEEESSIAYKELYEDLKKRLERESVQYKQKISHLQQTVEDLQRNIRRYSAARFDDEAVVAS